MFKKNLLIQFAFFMLLLFNSCNKEENISNTSIKTLFSRGGLIPFNGKFSRYSCSGESLSADVKIKTSTKNNLEILSLGAINGGGNGEKNLYFDEQLMKNQGWTAIGVRGNLDKKIEMWYRKNHESSNEIINFPANAKAFSYTKFSDATFKSISVSTNLSDSKNKKTKTVTYEVPKSNKEGFKILGYFSDDTVQLTNVGNKGKLINQFWGFGDGDALHTIIYSNKRDLPRNVAGIDDSLAGGEQYVGMLVTLTP